MHAYRNPSHEQALQRLALELGFETVVCSHQVCPLPRLVPRGQTALVEAAVARVLRAYLAQGRADLGEATGVRVMGSSGALLDPSALLAKDTILSGPAGGMVGAVAAARRAGLADGALVGFDMGGTSTDVFCVPAGEGLETLERSPQTEMPASRCWHRGCRFIRLPPVAARSSAPRSSACGWGPVPLVLIQGLLLQAGGPLCLTDAHLLLGRLQVAQFPAVFGPRGICRPIWWWCSSALLSWRRRWSAALSSWPRAPLIWLSRPWLRRSSKCRCSAVTTFVVGC